MSKKLRLSYSKASTFLHCKKEYDWAYNKSLVKKTKPVPLQVGDIVHQLFHLEYEGKIGLGEIEHLDEFVQKLYPLNTQQVTIDVAIQAATLFSGYLERYVDDPLTLVSSEMKSEFDYGDFLIYGKLDGLARTKDQRLWRLERKTTSAMDSFFLLGLKNSLQAGVYDFLLEKTMEEIPTGTIYDIMVKTKVPQYKRNLVIKNRRIIERSLKTLEGVYRDIQRGDFYPSCNCLSYNHECDYSALCNFDSPETRESFYELKPEMEEVKSEEKIATT